MDQHRVRQLGRIDWDFVSSGPSTNPGLHWYPGNFVPELPGALIDILTKPGERVFDPFGGIGTTGLAAIVRGRSAACCDVNPVAVLTSYVTGCLVILCRLRPTSFAGVFDELGSIVGSRDAAGELPFVDIAAELDDAIAEIAHPAPAEILGTIRVGPPNIDALTSWYSQTTLRDLIGIVDRANEKARPAFSILVSWVMLSSIARALSSQTRSWGHVADRVLPHEFIDKNAVRAAQGWLKRTKRRVAAIADESALATDRPLLAVHRVDWNAAGDNTLPLADLLITSPPYAGAIDYTLAQRLSLHLFGHDAAEVAALMGAEMGARRKRFDRNHVVSWADELCVAVGRQLDIMAPTATAAFVMPHKDAGRELGEESLKELMAGRGWSLDFERDRSIRQLKARQSWTSIKRETLLVFSREDQG